MSWLRLDDGFATNPKIAQLTDKEFRVWVRVLCYCAEHQDPSVDFVTIRVVSGLTSRLVLKLNDLGLLDETGDDFEVHDWLKYQPKDASGADRQAKWRARQALRRNGSRNGPRNGESNDPDRYENVTSRAGARARSRPVPVKPPYPNPAVDVAEPEPSEPPEFNYDAILKDMPL